MSGRRAYTDADRGRLRQAFIDAGRRLLGTPQAGTMSMRRIAAEAGYSPGAIYQYFVDQRALLVAIRELDMNAATDVMERAADRIEHPAERLRAVMLCAARYWLAHPEHFDMLFAGAPGRAPIHTADGTPFGRSPSVLRSLALYARVVEAFLASLPRRPVSGRMAMDTLIAAVHGVIAFPRATPSMRWSASEAMVECVLDALIRQWTAQAHAPP